MGLNGLGNTGLGNEAHGFYRIRVDPSIVHDFSGRPNINEHIWLVMKHFVILRALDTCWIGGRVVECAGLEIRFTGSPVTWVRIPPYPPVQCYSKCW